MYDREGVHRLIVDAFQGGRKAGLAERAAEIERLTPYVEAFRREEKRADALEEEIERLLEEAKYEAEALRIDGVAEGYRRGREEAARYVETWADHTAAAMEIAAAIRALAPAKEGAFLTSRIDAPPSEPVGLEAAGKVPAKEGEP